MPPVIGRQHELIEEAVASRTFRTSKLQIRWLVLHGTIEQLKFALVVEYEFTTFDEEVEDDRLYV
jgi:hypothetical protein